MKLVGKEKIHNQTCYDISVNKNNNFFVNGVCVHNSNSGIHYTPDGKISYKKRSGFVNVGSDNAGFAAWAIEKNFEVVEKSEVPFTIWGEWAGPGVQSGDAVSMTDKKRFYIFSVEYFNSDGEVDTDTNLIVDPDTIAEIVKDVDGFGDDIVVLPWADEAQKVYFFSPKEDGITAQEYANVLNGMIDRMEVRDDFIFDNYGVDKSGEGYVVYPLKEADDKIVNRGLFGTFVFKVKTEAHTASKVKGIKVAVEIPASVVDFVDTFVTEPRMEQMIAEHCGGEYSMKNTPVFMKALTADIEKESVNEREAGKLTMKDVSKLIGQRGVAWLKNKCDNL